MADLISHRTSCRLCEGTALSLVLPLRPTPIADHYVPAERCHEDQPLLPLDLFLCHACGHVQLLDVVDPEVLFRDYTYQTSASLGLVEHFRAFARELAGVSLIAKGDLVVEIGSNDGSLLNAFQEQGCRVLGVDPAIAIALQATGAGVETWPDFFTSGTARRIREERGRARLVLANNVFAHSDALGDMAEGIREVLTDDGLFVFEVSYLVDILDRLLFDTVYHEHLSYHAVAPLRTFLSRHGLELTDVQRLQTKGGSIRCFARKKGAEPRPAVDQLVALESERGLGTPEPFARFATRLEEIRSGTLRHCDTLEQGSAVLAGYGASATVTTLLYHFSLESRLRMLVDDNPRKHGMFSPGCHLPVHPSACLGDGNVDAVVLLAWQYARPILDRNQSFRAHGGRFLIPMPEPQIV